MFAFFWGVSFVSSHIYIKYIQSIEFHKCVNLLQNVTKNRQNTSKKILLEVLQYMWKIILAVSEYVEYKPFSNCTKI